MPLDAMVGWLDLPWLCIDTETTGLDPATCRIVELGAVVFHRGVVVRRMGMLVNPGIPIPAEATAVHGIADGDVADSPSLDQIAERFLGHVRGAQVLVGYNWPFDAAMLRAGLGAAWEEAIAGKPVLDPLVVVRFDAVGRYWKGAGRHRLDAVAERLGIARHGDAHRATSDCLLTCQLLRKLQAHLPADAAAASALIEAERQQQDAARASWQQTQERRRGDS